MRALVVAPENGKREEVNYICHMAISHYSN